MEFRQWYDEAIKFRDIAYALVNPSSLPPDARQFRTGYLHGKKARLSGWALKDNPYVDKMGKVPPEVQQGYEGWIAGFNSVQDVA